MLLPFVGLGNFMSVLQLHRHFFAICLWLGIAVCVLGNLLGCGAVLTTATVSTPQSILRAAKTSSDRVTLEVFQVRVPADDKALTEELWQAVDEQRVDFDARNRLVSNGFRAGVIAGTLPDALSRSLNLQSEMPEDTAERVVTDETATPKVTRRVLQLKQREPATIQTSEVQPSVHVFLNSENGLQGKSYEQAQGVYSLRTETVPGQQVELQLTPELQFGELKNRYGGSDQGIFVVTPSRERKVFDQLKINLPIAAGEMFVVSKTSGAPGSLGAVFHGERRGDAVEQKLVLIRLLQVPESEILADASLAAD
jgi:hypothetical protein